MIVIGLYSVLWGKYKESKEKKEREAMSLPVALTEGEGCQLADPVNETSRVTMCSAPVKEENAAAEA